MKPWSSLQRCCRTFMLLHKSLPHSPYSVVTNVNTRYNVGNIESVYRMVCVCGGERIRGIGVSSRRRMGEKRGG